MWEIQENYIKKRLIAIYLSVVCVTSSMSSYLLYLMLLYLIFQFLSSLEGSNQINMSFARIRRHYITPYLASFKECKLLSRLPDPMSRFVLSLFLALSRFFPPVNTTRLVCGTRDLHVSRRPATVRWYHGFVWREVRVRARPGSASSRLLYVEKALAGAGRMFRRDSWRNCRRRKDSPLRRTWRGRGRRRRMTTHVSRVRVSRIPSRARARRICLAIAINSSCVDSMAVFVTSANLICN